MARSESLVWSFRKTQRQQAKGPAITPGLILVQGW